VTTISNITLQAPETARVAEAEKRAKGDGNAWKEGEIKRLSNEFESLFLSIVLKSMRNSVQKSGLMDGGNAEEIYRSMLDEEYAKSMAEQRHTGIADNIEEFMRKAQFDNAGIRSGVEKADGVKKYALQGLQGYSYPGYGTQNRFLS